MQPGGHVRLEPLDHRHVDGLVAAAAGDPSLYRRSPVRSRAALERIGGKFEGILRAHRMAADFIPRDSVRYSIVAEEWTEVKGRLGRLLGQRG